MIKGQVFANQLFENQIFALFINTFTNGKDGVSDNYKNGMAITYSGSDVTIDSGAVLIQGRFLEEDTSTTISAGADNMYCKLVIEIDLDKTNTTTEFNQGYYKIVKSSSTWPTLTQTNIVKNVSGIYQYELARFRTTANGITDFEDRRTFIDFDSIYDEIREHIQDIDDGSLWVQKSGDTMTGKLIAEGGIEGNVQGNVQGNVTGNVTGNCSGTASKWATARTITLSGDLGGSVSIDGSQNKTLTNELVKNSSSEFTINANGGSSYGNIKLRFYKVGGTVQIEGVVTLKSGKSAATFSNTINVPTWARIARTNVNRSQYLIREYFDDPTGINMTGGLTIAKNVNDEYVITCSVTSTTAVTSDHTWGFTGCYVIN